MNPCPAKVSGDGIHEVAITGLAGKCKLPGGAEPWRKKGIDVRLSANQSRVWYPMIVRALATLACFSLVEACVVSVFATVSVGAVRNNPTASVSPGDANPGQVDWPGLALVQVTSTIFHGPTCIAHAGDGSGRLFVVDQAGLVRIVQSNNVLPQPFLDIANRVLSGGERGLLCVAFPPAFATKGHFYVDYTRK